MLSKPEMVMIMMDTVYALNFREAVVQAVTVQVVTTEAVAIVVLLQNGRNIVFWFLAYRHRVHGKT